MSVDPGSMQSHQSFSDFVSSHQSLVYGGGVVLVLVVAGIFMNSKNKTAPATSTADLSGLTGGKVFVPTSTNFTTENIKYGQFSNDPNLTTVTNSGNVNKTTTVTKTVNPIPVPVRQPPPPTPVPPTRGKGLIWDQRYSIHGGETLSSIAAVITRNLRARGMSGSMSVTWHDLYGHNTDLINRTAQAHGFRSD